MYIFRININRILLTLLTIFLKQKKSSMWFKENLKKSLADKDLMIANRLKSSTFVLAFTSLLFFLNYFFVWARFHYDFFIKTLPYTYILLLVWFLFYFSYLNLKFLSKVSSSLSYVIIIIFSIIFIGLAFLFII